MYNPVYELASFDMMPVDVRKNMLELMLEALIGINRFYLRNSRNTPAMYSAGLTYKFKIRPFGLDTWQDIPRTIFLKSGDCKDFVCWRVAEMRESGAADVAPRIIVQESAGGPTVYHIQLRQDLTVEDPSKILGMTSVTQQEVSNLIQGTGGVSGILDAMQKNRMPGARGMKR